MEELRPIKKPGWDDLGLQSELPILIIFEIEEWKTFISVSWLSLHVCDSLQKASLSLPFTHQHLRRVINEVFRLKWGFWLTSKHSRSVTFLF